jgi:hypothetical protein
MSAAYRAAAKTLRQIADTIAALADHPALDDSSAATICLTVYPLGVINLPTGDTAADAAAVTAVDTIARGLLGGPGTTKPNPGRGDHTHQAVGVLGPINVIVRADVTDPAERERAAELAALRAELEAARGELAAITAPADGGDPA